MKSTPWVHVLSKRGLLIDKGRPAKMILQYARPWRGDPMLEFFDSRSQCGETGIHDNVQKPTLNVP